MNEKERSRIRRQDPAYIEQQKKWSRDSYHRNKNDPEWKQRKAAAMRTYTKDPILRERHMARWILNRRLKTGAVVRGNCFCGDVTTQAHHDDYAKPLEVIWLCIDHHRELHASAKEGKDGE